MKINSTGGAAVSGLENELEPEILLDNQTQATEQISVANPLTDMDALVKLLLMAGLAVAGFWSGQQLSFAVLALFLAVITLLGKIRGRVMLVSAASYGIIVVLPYLFGILMNWIVYRLTGRGVGMGIHETSLMLLKLERLFFLWYISILYFQLTPTKTVIGMLDMLLFPLKKLKVPVEEYLKILMCVVLELGEMPAELKKSLGGKMKEAIGRNKPGLKSKIRGVADLLVNVLVDSFQKVGRVQSFVESVDNSQLYQYRFKVSKNEIFAVFITGLLMTAIFSIEHGLG